MNDGSTESSQRQPEARNKLIKDGKVINKILNESDGPHLRLVVVAFMTNDARQISSLML